MSMKLVEQQSDGTNARPKVAPSVTEAAPAAAQAFEVDLPANLRPGLTVLEASHNEVVVAVAPLASIVQLAKHAQRLHNASTKVAFVAYNLDKVVKEDRSPLKATKEVLKHNVSMTGKESISNVRGDTALAHLLSTAAVTLGGSVALLTSLKPESQPFVAFLIAMPVLFTAMEGTWIRKLTTTPVALVIDGVREGTSALIRTIKGMTSKSSEAEMDSVSRSIKEAGEYREVLRSLPKDKAEEIEGETYEHILGLSKALEAERDKVAGDFCKLTGLTREAFWVQELGDCSFEYRFSGQNALHEFRKLQKALAVQSKADELTRKMSSDRFSVRLDPSGSVQNVSLSSLNELQAILDENRDKIIQGKKVYFTDPKDADHLAVNALLHGLYQNASSHDRKEAFDALHAMVAARIEVG